jgi:hypothetical protein
MSETYGARPLTELSRGDILQYLDAMRFGPGPQGIVSPYSREDLQNQLETLTQTQRALLNINQANQPFLGMEGNLPGSLMTPPAPGGFSPGMGAPTQADLRPADRQPTPPLPPVQERVVRPTAEIVSVPQYQPPPQAQPAAILPAPVPAPQQASVAPSSGVSGNTLLGLAALTDAFAILGGRQPTMLAQMAPIAQQRSQQQALSQIIAQRTQGNLSPQQAALLGNAVQQAATTTQAPQAGEAPYGGGFSARGLAVNTQMESGGRPDARNPLSTAVGANQFIERTWLDFASANPQLFPNMDREQILAARTNPELSAQATQWNARRNGEVLQNANLPVNDATLGMAHMFGPQGARRILESRSDARIEDIVTPDVLRANPNLAGRTAGDLAQDFARRYAPTPMTPAQAQITAPTPAAPSSLPGTALRPRGVAMTPELAASLNALAREDPQAALRTLTQLDLQAASQSGSRMLSDTEARAILGPRYDPEKQWYLDDKGIPKAVEGTLSGQTREQQRSEENTLRASFLSQQPVKDYLAMSSQVRSIRDAATREDPSRYNDINLVYAFAKMLDPNSVVRETEYGMVIEAGGVEQRVYRWGSVINGRSAFNDQTRREILREAEGRYNSTREAYDVQADAFRELARTAGVRPEMVIPPVPRIAPAQTRPQNRPALAEGDRQGAVDYLRAEVQGGRMTAQQAIQEARNAGIPNAERLFQ